MSASKVNNNDLIESIIDSSFILTEKYLTDIRLSKILEYWVCFYNYLIKPSLNKKLIMPKKIIDILMNWIEIYHESSLFCEHLTSLLDKIQHETDKGDALEFKNELFDTISDNLLNKVMNDNKIQCLIPYLFIITSSSDSNNIKLLDEAVMKCNSIIQKYSSNCTYKIICHGLATIFNNCGNFSTLYQSFIDGLDCEKKWIFFELYYSYFIEELSCEKQSIICEKSMKIWNNEIRCYLNVLIESTHEDESQMSERVYIVFKHLANIQLHRQDNKQIMELISSIIKLTLETKEISLETNHQFIKLMNFCIDHLARIHLLDILHPSFAGILMKLILCSDDIISLTHVETYLEYQNTSTRDKDYIQMVNVELMQDLLNLHECNKFELLSQMIGCILEKLNSENVEFLVRYFANLVFIEIEKFEEKIFQQSKYNHSLTQDNEKYLLKILHKLCIIVSLFNKNESNMDLSILQGVLEESIFLILPIVSQTLCFVLQSTIILEQYDLLLKFSEKQINCDKVDTFILSFNKNYFNLINRCPTLFMQSLGYFIDLDHSNWSTSVTNQIDESINNWMDTEMPKRDFDLFVTGLLPKAVKARYVVQELMLVSLTSYLSVDSCPTLVHVNRALRVMNCLIKNNSDYYAVCYPILMEVKSIFEPHIDQLYPANDNSFDNLEYFDLTTLLELLSVAVEYNKDISSSHWEFILCLTAALSRSEMFKDCIDYRTSPCVDNCDYLINGYWLMKLIINITIALVDIKNDSIIDEWDNFFCESIFTVIIDQFSVISNNYKEGQLVCDDLFELYQEALSDVVSLCPLTVLNNYSYACQIDVNDPIELPKQFLLTMNYFLDSLSSYSLSIQLAGYNSLLNLIEPLRDYLNNEFNKKEVEESIESFNLSLPVKFTQYLCCENFLQLNLDNVENQVVLTRCLLTWNLMLHLVTNSPSKLRAEITAFLTQDSKLFDNFQSFCFSFMPKNPIINKSQYSFLSTSNNNVSINKKSKYNAAIMNLVADEPQIFNSCLNKRSEILLYHLSCFTFGKSIQTLPSLTRRWWLSLQNKSQATVEEYVKQFITPEIFKREFHQLTKQINDEKDDKVRIDAVPLLGKVTVKYNVNDEQTMKQTIELPRNYPLGPVNWEFKQLLANHDNRWRAMIIQLTAMMQNQNGTILDCVKLLRCNWDNYFNGLEECMICYALLHQTKFTLPSMKCTQCRKKFHKDCMYQWFRSSPNPTCPNCRNLFFDGTYKRLANIGAPVEE